MMTTAIHFAEKLLHIQAVKLNPDNPFTWTSGWKSPIYCDNRKILSFPHIRDYVKSELANTIMEQFPEAEALSGVATAGIAHGALAADILKLPYTYVRSKPKGHGLGNQIEGIIEPGQKVVVIEDLVSTGKSSLEAVEALRASGAQVIGLCALFTYGFEAASQSFEDNNVKFVSLSDYNNLITLLIDNGTITEDKKATLEAWRLNPATWMQ
jgi:orotate phosphoribosyltransferase